MVKLSKIFSRYPIYILVGAGVTVTTVLLRSVIGILMKDDTIVEYMSSIILAYILGFFLSLVAHKSITFKVEKRLSIDKSIKFVGIHLFGMSFTLLGSTLLRKSFLDAWLSIELSKMLAFAIPAFMVSIITYLLKKYFVFEQL